MKKMILRFQLLFIFLLALSVLIVSSSKSESAEDSVLGEPGLQAVNELSKTWENRLSSAVKLINDMKFDEALILLKLLAEEQPDNAEIHYMTGYCHSIMQRYKKAVKAYKKAILIKPDYPVAFNNLGVCYSALKRYDKAIGAYRQAIFFDPEEARYYPNLASTYIKLGRYEEAIESFKKAVSLKPGISGWHLDLGLAYLSIGDEASALKQCEVLKELNPHLANELLKVIKGETDTIRLFEHPQKPPVPLDKSGTGT